ncbi:hypothetical protein [Streptomyces sp. NPDC058657]|uniref:hypothetical protein n=1 Tax=unclassified Streptomyces TaxID=2593676 RepID=UPI00364EB615
MFTLPASVPTIMAALDMHGIPAFYDPADELLIAHPAAVSRDKAMESEHITIDLYGFDGADSKPSGGLTAKGWSVNAEQHFVEEATVFEALAGDPIAYLAPWGALAISQWLAPARRTAGDVLRTALAQWNITAHTDGLGMSYAVPMDPATPAEDVRNHLHLSVGDRNPSVEHVPAVHTGWTVWAHDENGEPVGDPVFISGNGGLVDCVADSAAAAEAIANYCTRPAH